MRVCVSACGSVCVCMCVSLCARLVFITIITTMVLSTRSHGAYVNISAWGFVQVFSIRECKGKESCAR